MGVLTFSRDMRSCRIARMLIGLPLIFPLLFTAGPVWPAGNPTIFGYAYDPDAAVDVELILAVDISQSMDRDEQEVQRAGYVAALTSPQVVDAIRYGPLGRIPSPIWNGAGLANTTSSPTGR